MIVQMDEGLTERDRVRVTLEGACVVGVEQSWDNHRMMTFDGPRFVQGARTDRVTVENPERVWVQSLDPDKVRERITGDFPNPDAVALQARLDKANAENERLRAQIASERENYEASKALWKKSNRERYWLEGVPLASIAAAIEAGEPEPDSIDW